MKFLSLLLIVFLFFSCSNDDDSYSALLPTTLEQPLVCVFYPTNGMGDLTYNDSIHQGITKAEKKFNLLQIGYSPENWDQARDYIKYIFGEIKNNSFTNKEVLCFFIGSQYFDCFDDENDLPNASQATVLFFDVDEDLVPTYLQNKIHTLFIPYYGACYAAGQIIAKKKQASQDWRPPLIILPDSNNDIIFNYSQAFIEGMGETPPDTVEKAKTYEFDIVDSLNNSNKPYFYTFLIVKNLENPSLGFDSGELLYQLSSIYNSSYNISIVLPLCGGSTLGLLHFAQENSDIMHYSVIGVDVDMSETASTAVPFSIIKDSAKVAYESIELWLNGKLPKEATKTFAQGYTRLEKSNYEDSIYSKFLDDNTLKAATEAGIKYEEKILKDKNND